MNRKIEKLKFLKVYVKILKTFRNFSRVTMIEIFNNDCTRYPVGLKLTHPKEVENTKIFQFLTFLAIIYEHFCELDGPQAPNDLWRYAISFF